MPTPQLTDHQVALIRYYQHPPAGTLPLSTNETARRLDLPVPLVSHVRNAPATLRPDVTEASRFKVTLVLSYDTTNPNPNQEQDIFEDSSPTVRVSSYGVDIDELDDLVNRLTFDTATNPCPPPTARCRTVTRTGHPPVPVVFLYWEDLSPLDTQHALTVGTLFVYPYPTLRTCVSHVTQ